MNKPSMKAELEKPVTLSARGGMYHKEEKREKVIRIRSKLYKKLAALGSVENDMDDVISMVFEFYEQHHGKIKDKEHHRE